MNKSLYMLKIFVLAGILVLAPTLNAKSSAAAPTGKPDWAEFKYFCQMHRGGADLLKIAPPPVDQISFIPVRALQNQQTDFSFIRLLQQLQKGIHRGGAEFSRKNDRWKLPFDNGRSLFGDDSDLVGIYYRGRVYLADGHHKALASIYIGAETAPVHILGDWSKLTQQEFDKAMSDLGYSHWVNYRGHAVKPVDFCAMVDNPNLMLARLLIRRIVVEGRGQRIKIEVGSGSELPIALKINHDIAFLEREIADAISRAGHTFDDTRADEDIPKKERAMYLEILQRVAPRHPRLKHVLLLKKPTKVESLDLEAIIREHLAQPECEQKLLARSR